MSILGRLGNVDLLSIVGDHAPRLAHGAAGVDTSGGGAGLLTGVAPDHVQALFAPLFLPVVIWLFLSTARSLGRAGVPWAMRFADGYVAAPFLLKVTAALFVIASAVHVGLVP